MVRYVMVYRCWFLPNVTAAKSKKQKRKMERRTIIISLKEYTSVIKIETYSIPCFGEMHH